jgi:signal transduction histidine kinase/ligand-binding sensor domain-containing protein
VPLHIPSRLRAALAMVLLSASLGAEYLPVKAYTIADGLMSDGEILHMIQDSRGYLWICGSLGISRFDGHAFRNYGQADGLPVEGAYYALETKDGTLWFGTSHGLARYVPNAGALKRFVMYSLGEPPAADGTNIADDIHMLCEDPHGGLWIGSARGLYHATPSADGLHARFVLRPDVPAGAEPPAITRMVSLLSDSHGVLWAGTHYAGIYRILPGGAVEHYTVSNGLPANVIGSFLEDHLGRIWFTTPHGLLLLSSSPRPDRSIVSQFFDTTYGLTENRLWSLVETGDGHIWIGSNMGLAEFDGKRFRTYTPENGLTEKQIFSLLVDRQGNLWAGTHSSGVMRLARNGITTYRESDGLLGGDVTSFLETRGGSLLAVPAQPEQFPVQVWNGRGFSLVWPRFPKEVKLFASGSGQRVLQDHTGEWWMATRDGLCRFARTESANGLSGMLPKRRYTTRDGLPSDSMYALFEDSGGDIWIGSGFRERAGTARWKRGADVIEDLSQAAGALKDRAAVSFVEDASGAIWIAFLGGGLSRYRDGRFTPLTEREGVPPGAIHLYLDTADRLWGAADSGGVFRVDRRNTDHPRFVRFTTGDGLSTDWANAITGDLNGRIYVGTVHGVDRIDPNTGRITHLTAADGLASNAVISAFRDRSGDLWFGTRNGLSRLTVSRNPAAAPPAVRITELRIDDRPIPLSDFGEASIGSLKIASHNHLQISFAGINLDSALRFQYKLEGSGRDWSQPEPQQSVVYPGFPSGKYRFLVRALNADDAFSPLAATLSLSVLPPIWLRWWFLLLASATVAIAIWQWQRYRMARLLEVERLRTRIATDLHDDIGTSLSHIAVLSELARRKIDEPHAGLADYLAQISRVSQEASAAVGDVVWAINPQRDSLNDLVLRMRRFAVDVLSAREIEVRFNGPDVDGSRKLESDVRRQLFLVFKEAVNNVARHAQASTVRIDLRIDRDAVVLEVSDDGKGFDPQQAGSGNGLHNLRRRAQRLYGNFSIQSSPGNGAQMRFRAPLRK